jgi:hypothetical protein
MTRLLAVLLVLGLALPARADVPPAAEGRMGECARVGKFFCRPVTAAVLLITTKESA